MVSGMKTGFDEGVQSKNRNFYHRIPFRGQLRIIRVSGHMYDGLLWERVCAGHGSYSQGVCHGGQGRATKKTQTDI